jgi:hypothetical protein
MYNIRQVKQWLGKWQMSGKQKDGLKVLRRGGLKVLRRDAQKARLRRFVSCYPG